MSERCRFVATLLAAVLAAGCEHAFEPFQERDDLVFSMFGFLELSADTQWVRVTPVRQEVIPGARPLDAVVTLERVGGGRVVTLRDSVVVFVDTVLGSSAYVHNFWTTERMEPGAEYLLTARRSDGASTTARVGMPERMELTFQNDLGIAAGSVGTLQVRAEHVVSVEVLYLMRSTGRVLLVVPVRQAGFASSDPAAHGFRVEGLTLERESMRDVVRQEIRITTARSGWPFRPDLSELEISIPSGVPSNVENGVGYVGGVHTWTIPFHRCEVIVPRPDAARTCRIVYDGRAASIEGKAVRQSCGDPDVLREIHLTERLPDGGVVVRHWKTGPGGEYRFEGIEPGARLTLEIRGLPVLLLPTLGAGQRYLVPDFPVPVGC